MPTQTKQKPITLGDLSAEDRKALVEEAREAAKRNPTDVPGYDRLTSRERATRALMDARDHARGCPVQEGRDLGRIEGYDGRKPPNPATGEPERMLGVVRCVECGGASVLEVSIDVAIAAALEEDPELHNDTANRE